MENKKSMRLTLTDIYLAVICIFPIPTMLTDGGMVNKFLFALLIGLQLAMFFDRKVKGRTLIVILLLAVNFVYTLGHTRFPMTNFNLIFYFPFYLVYTYFVCDNSRSIMDWFAKQKKFITAVVVLWTVLVGTSVFLPGSYYVKEGGAKYFGSFVGSVFRLGPSAVFIQVLAILMQLIYGNKKAILFHVIPMYSYFMGSSRTYLVVGACLLLVAWYFFCNSKGKFYLSLIPMALAAVILISVTSMGEKIMYTLDEEQYGDFWFRITSSRSVIWKYLLRYWNYRVPLLSKLLGASLNFSYEKARLWAHNDFVELLGSFGLVGLAQYLVSIFVLFKPQKQKKKMPFVIGLLLVIVWLFNAFFNMHYVYFCAMLSYPLLVLSVKHYYAQINEPKGSQRQQNGSNVGDHIYEKGSIYLQH